jgi:hypothetical protein
MKKYLLFIIIGCIFPTILTAQKEAYNQLVPTGIINFKHDSLGLIPFGDKEQEYKAGGRFGLTYSDRKTGEILFYTTDSGIYNRERKRLIVSDKKQVSSLQKWLQIAGTLIVVPFPDGSPQYYLFGSDTVCCIIDLRTSPGKVSQKVFYRNTQIEDKRLGYPFYQNKVSVAGTIDCQNNGYWIIYCHDQLHILFSFHITNEGIDSNPIISDFRNTSLPNNDLLILYCKLSPDGKTLVYNNHKNSDLYFFDFDNRTGKFSHPRVLLDSFSTMKNLVFSPNSKILYFYDGKRYGSGQAIWQYDISLKDTGLIRQSGFSINLKPDEVNGLLMLHPDKRIYYHCLGFAHIIHKPNNLKYNCQVQFNVPIEPLDLNVGNRWYANHRRYEYLSHIFSDDYKGYPCFEPRGTLDTIYGCINTPLRITHRYSDGIILSRQWSIDSANIIEQRDSSCLFSINKTGTYRIQLFCKRNSRIDTLLTYAIINDAQAQAGKDTILCAGTSIKIGTQGEQGTTYRWYPTKGLDDYTKANPTASPDTTTEYIFAVINKYGCSAYDTIKITVVPSVQPTITRDTTLCAWIPLQLQAGGGTKYEWFPKSGLNNYFIANPIALPSTTTRYKVIISNATCTDSAFVTITIKENEKADAAEIELYAQGCQSDSAQIIIRKWNILGRLPIIWIIPKVLHPLCTPEKNMQYILTVKNSNGCENYDTVNVTLGGELSVFAGADTSVCEGEQIQLNASGAENFSWSPAEGLSNATIANPLFTGTSTTQYIVTGKSGNCEGKDTILVTVNEKPIIITSENREICW